MAITITHKDPNDETSPAMFGAQELLSYGKTARFSELVLESLMGEKPSDEQKRMFDLILNLCFDHGPNSPSSSATIAAAKEGKSMGEAVAAGIAQINDSHGGAGEPLMKILYSIQRSETTAPEIVGQYKKDGKRMPGYGHRVYKDADPRAQELLAEVRKISHGGDFADYAEEIRKEIENQLGKKLPINIDGAIAVTLCALGMPPESGKAVFIVARSAGLCAHFLNNSK